MTESLNQCITIIIPNFNGLKYLAPCLSSIFQQDYQNFEVVLVDNGSTDGSVDFVKQNFSSVRIIANNRNAGFAEANNMAIQATSAPYIVTLNNDTTVDKNWLIEMVKAAKSDFTIGMIACKIVYMEQPHIIDSAGLEIDRMGMPWNRWNGQVDRNDEFEPYPVFCPTAAAALYKREMLDDIGLFDEAFFAYCEDMDLGWRARLRGWECLYVPTAVVYHHHSATSGQGSPFKRYLLTRNRVWTVLKNYPAPDIWLNLPKLLFFDALAMVYRLIKEKNSSPISSRIAALGRIGQVWRQRQQIQAGRRISNEALQALMTPTVKVGQSISKQAPAH